MSAIWKPSVLLLLMSSLALPACGSGDDKNESTSEDEDDGKKKKKKKKKTGDDGDKDAKKPKMTLKGKFGGKDIEFKHAVVADQGTSAVWIHLAKDAPDCAKMSPGFAKTGKEDLGIAIELAPQVQPDGKVKWVVDSANFKQGDKRGRKVNKEAKVDKVEGTSKDGLSADVDFTIENKDGDKLELKGMIVAKGCGAKGYGSAKNLPELRPQKDVKTTISGHAFDIQSALLTTEKDGDVVLQLTTSGQKCNKYSSTGDFGISLKLDKDKKKSTYSYFRGDMMASDYNTTHDPKGTYEVGAEKDGKVNVKVDYEHEAFGFKIAVKGDVEALVCTEKK